MKSIFIMEILFESIEAQVDLWTSMTTHRPDRDEKRQAYFLSSFTAAFESAFALGLSSISFWS